MNGLRGYDLLVVVVSCYLIPNIQFTLVCHRLPVYISMTTGELGLSVSVQIISRIISTPIYCRPILKDDDDAT